MKTYVDQRTRRQVAIGCQECIRCEARLTREIAVERHGRMVQMQGRREEATGSVYVHTLRIADDRERSR